MTFISVTCSFCGKTFQKNLRSFNQAKKRNFQFSYCSKQCYSSHKNRCQSVVCLHCKQTFTKYLNEIISSPNHFCSHSCAASYNNTHKTKGCRRSKLEIWLESQLLVLYPNLDVVFNNKSFINSELDIFFPTLRLAFELNGIFHYEPIYGSNKLNQIQNNDNRKFQACLENGIELCIIDTSGLINFKPLKAQKYLDIITHVVSSRLSEYLLPSS